MALYGDYTWIFVSIFGVVCQGTQIEGRWLVFVSLLVEAEG